MGKQLYVYWYKDSYMGGLPIKAINDAGQRNEAGYISEPVTVGMKQKGFKICPDQAAAEERYEKEYAQRIAERKQAESKPVANSNGAEGYYDSDKVNATDGAIAYAKEHDIPWHKIDGAMDGKRITMFELKAFTGEQ